MIKRRDFLKTAALSSAVFVIPNINFAQPQNESNFLSNNSFLRINGIVTANGNPIKNVAVSDGETVVITDENGNYELITKNRFVFISIPSGYKIPQNETGTALFYKEIDRKKRISFYPFELEKSGDDSSHSFIVFADPQTLDAQDMERFRKETIPDLKQTIKDKDLKNVFGVSNGDIVFDNLDLYPDYQDRVKESSIPFFQVLGNHDVDKKAKTDETSINVFENYFGPAYYSFNRGNIHYVVLDDIFWFGGYMGYLNQKMLDWLKNDLAFVEKGKTVVIFSHIPPYTTQALRNRDKKENDRLRIVNKELLYDLLNDYKSYLICGHTHESQYLQDNGIDVHVCGAVCGAWWTSDICIDGTPNGYSIYTVNGDSISWKYKSTGKSLNHQLRVYKPQSEFNKTDEIIANVWSYDKNWIIEWLEDGLLKGEMENRIDFDPLSKELYSDKDKLIRHKWISPVKNDHMFFAKPSKSAKSITVKVTDRWGNIFKESFNL